MRGVSSFILSRGIGTLTWFTSAPCAPLRVNLASGVETISWCFSLLLLLLLPRREAGTDYLERDAQLVNDKERYLYMEETSRDSWMMAQCLFQPPPAWRKKRREKNLFFLEKKFARSCQDRPFLYVLIVIWQVIYGWTKKFFRNEGSLVKYFTPFAIYARVLLVRIVEKYKNSLLWYFYDLFVKEWRRLCLPEASPLEFRNFFFSCPPAWFRICFDIYGWYS